MSEPIFIAQSAEPMTGSERRSWVEARIAEGRGFGATFFRAAIHPEFRELTLVEGWKDSPDDQGEPRFDTHRSENGR